MNSWKGYSQNFLEEMRGLKLSSLEKVLFGALMLMCLISAFDSVVGRNVGNYEQLRAAKMQAQQELMALRVKSE